MLWLRRGWLWAIGCALVIGGGTALFMRFELVAPEPRLAPELYGHALAVHGLMALGVLVAAVIAIPTLVMKSGRGSVTLGFLALGTWAAAITVLVGLELHGSQEPLLLPQTVLLVLGASLALGAAQIGVSLRANTGPLSQVPLVALVAAAGGITAFATVASSLIASEPPTAIHWLVATTAVVCTLLPDATKRGARTFMLFVSVPCLLLAWPATALVHGVRTDYFHDTVAMLSPLPLTGGALLGALLQAATRVRTPRHRLATVAATLITSGATLASVGFFLLGSRGLPRRYFAYLPEFQPLQIVVGIAAAVSTIGCVIAIEAFRRGTRADA